MEPSRRRGYLLPLSGQPFWIWEDNFKFMNLKVILSPNCLLGLVFLSFVLWFLYNATLLMKTLLKTLQDLAREMRVLRQGQPPNVFTFPCSVVKQEPQSLLKVGKQPLSKEHHVTYLPASMWHCPCDSEQGPRVSLPRDPVTCQCPWESRVGLLAHLSS